MKKNQVQATVPFSVACQKLYADAVGSNFKVVVAGPYIEVQVYERNILHTGKPRRSVGRQDKCASDDPIERNSNMKAYRARRKARKLGRIINENFTDGDTFITLTFQTVKEIDESLKAFRRFLQELQRKVPGVKYIAVVEPHQRSGYHLHAIINRQLPKDPEEAAPFIKEGVIKSKKGCLSALWPHGFIHVKILDTEYGNLGHNLANYITKATDDPRMHEKHKVYRSDNLKAYTTMCDCDGISFLQREVVDKGLTEIYSYTQDKVDYVGSYHYFAFNRLEAHTSQSSSRLVS
ncbi:rolling circle replication-associated protein [Dendrosporobacter sp. 1207_IL3150]|uniref:rolling circle replication-associated protein n=1 Tax=Dendrosporobacter sp. 1207_IL3150 TaxID=3084054 RepID=UPI002FDA44EA